MQNFTVGRENSGDLDFFIRADHDTIAVGDTMTHSGCWVYTINSFTVVGDEKFAVGRLKNGAMMVARVDHVPATVTGLVRVGRTSKVVHNGTRIAGRWIADCGQRGGRYGMGVATPDTKATAPTCSKCLSQG